MFWKGWRKSDKSVVTKTRKPRSVSIGIRMTILCTIKSCTYTVLVIILHYINIVCIIHNNMIRACSVIDDHIIIMHLYHNNISLSYIVCITRIPTWFEIDNICLPSRNYIFITYADTRAIILYAADCVVSVYCDPTKGIGIQGDCFII